MREYRVKCISLNVTIREVVSLCIGINQFTAE